MLCLKEAIVVEGRYDKISLENLVDTEIFTTEGFGIFNDREKMSLLRRVAQKRGLVHVAPCVHGFQQPLLLLPNIRLLRLSGELL